MSNTERDALLEQLQNAEKPKQRVKACRQLAKARDPEAIPALVSAYQNDPDEKVRKAARDALGRFKRMQTKSAGPVDRVFSLLLGVLVLGFVVSLVLHGIALLEDDNAEIEGIAPTRQLLVSERNSLIVDLGSKMSEAQALATNLRVETQKYNDTGQVDCPISYAVPTPIELTDDDQYVYPDIRLYANTYDSLLPKLEITIKLLENACLNPDDQTNSVIKAAQRLDEVDGQLGELNTILQNAIANPAPTVWPTLPPVSPTPTETLIPATPTQPQVVTPLTAVPGDATPVGAVPTSEPVATLGPTPTPTPQPTATLTPEPTLPRPNLDYAAILEALETRLTQDFLLDLQNPFGTGMLDQWEQALTARGQTTTNYCGLSAWPEPYSLPPDQQTLLDEPGTADQQLEEALTAYQDGMALARQARELYTRDCSTMDLARSADQGSRLVREAITKLARTQELLDEIANRP